MCPLLSVDIRIKWPLVTHEEGGRILGMVATDSQESHAMRGCTLRLARKVLGKREVVISRPRSGNALPKCRTGDRHVSLWGVHLRPPVTRKWARRDSNL